MRKLVSVVLSLFFGAAPTSAEIFKCVAKDGVVVYQNFPCEIDSLGSLPSVPTVTGALPTPAESNQAKPTAVASAARAADPRIGMTAEEVRAIWGEPTDTLWEEPGVGDRSEVWSYGNSRSVRFVKSRVSAVQK
jgi:hypothetical protein